MKKIGNSGSGKTWKKRRKLRIKMWYLKPRRMPRRLINFRFFYSIWFKGILFSRFSVFKGVEHLDNTTSLVLFSLPKWFLFYKKRPHPGYTLLNRFNSEGRQMNLFKLPTRFQYGYFSSKLNMVGSNELSKTTGRLDLFKSWKYLWQIYRKIFLRYSLYKRSVAIVDGERRISWYDKRPQGGVILHHSSWSFCSKKKILPRVYLSSLWSIAIRMKLEKFFFHHSGRRTYVWMHNIWTLAVKNISSWSKHERKSLRHLVKKKSKMSFRPNVAKSFLKTLGLFFSVPGSSHCLVHVIAFLLGRFRKHWQLLNMITRSLKFGKKRFSIGSSVSYRIAISGKFAGKMRSGKNVFGCGKMKFFMLDWKVEYVRTDSFTRWGVFGIQVWTQMQMVHKLEDSTLYTNGKSQEIYLDSEAKGQKRRAFQRRLKEVCDLDKCN